MNLLDFLWVFWVLLINLLVFNFLSNTKNKKRNFLKLLIALLLPIIISIYINSSYTENKVDKMNVLVVQPNIEPYTEKFNIPAYIQLLDFIELAEQKLVKETDLLIGPETALVGPPIDEDKLESNYQIQVFRMLQKKYQNLNIILGAITKKTYSTDSEVTKTVRKINGEHYDLYNSLIFIPNQGDVQIYHKSKLVPGAEKMPFPLILDPIAKMVIDLGGTSGSLGSPNYTEPFNINGYLVSPLICYESIYGDMQSSNSSLIIVATNDGGGKILQVTSSILIIPY